jgi:Uma2 family endonuclease
MADRDTASPMPPALKLTYEDYVTLPDDGRRYEILDGELVVTPAPTTRHQLVSGNLEMILRAHVRAHDLGTILDAPVDVILDQATVVQPDLLFVSKAKGHIVEERAVEGAPDLVVEILSPTTEHRDRGAKMKLYARFGVAHYWLVDVEAQVVEVRMLADGTYQLVGTYERQDVLPVAFLGDLAIDMAEVWP